MRFSSMITLTSQSQIKSIKKVRVEVSTLSFVEYFSNKTRSPKSEQLLFEKVLQVHQCATISSKEKPDHVLVIKTNYKRS